MDSYRGCYRIVPSAPPPSHEAKRQGRKSTALLAVMCSTVFLVAVIYAGIQLADTNGAKIGPNSIQSLDLIENVCNATLYFNLCITSLLSSPGFLEANMSELARIAVKVSLDEAIRVNDFVVELTKSAENQTLIALEDCTEVLDDTVDQLNSSVSVLGEDDWKQSMDDLRTWLSAAVTNPSSCVDDFEDARLVMDECMKQKLENLRELVSNDLAIVDFVFSSENVHGKLFPKLL